MSQPPMGRQPWVRSSTLGLGVVLVTFLFLLGNYFGWKYHKRLDWTQSEIYSLSGKTLNLLEELDQDLEAVVFMTPASILYDPVRELLARYDAASQRFSLRVIDPERNPAEAQQLLDQYQVRSLSVVIAAGEDRRVIDEADLADFDYSGLQFGQEAQMTGFKGEQLITGAILELLEDRKPKMVFTGGHGEASHTDVSVGGLSQARDILGQDNFEVEEWFSLGQPGVPEGTDVVFIAGPQTHFIESELEALSSFLDRGGRVLLTVDPSLSDTGLDDTGLDGWLARYGIQLGENIVIDPDQSVPFVSAETFFATSYEEHPVTKVLAESDYPVIFSLARSVSQADDGAATGVTVTELLHTSPDGWGETDLVNLQEVARDDADEGGPVSLGVAVEIDRSAGSPGVEEGGGEAPLDGEREATVGDGEGGSPSDDPDAGLETAATDAENGEEEERAPSGRLVVFGDSDFATNAQLGSAGNPVLLLNTVNWLVERQKLVGIPPKKAEQVRLSLTWGELSSIFWSVLILLPGVGVILGVTVYFKRRR